MKVFEDGDKLNVVDENNVFVGYDLGQSCCENAGYFFSKEVPKEFTTDETSVEFKHEDFVFDPAFFQEIPDGSDGGGMAIFKLKNKEGEEVFLCLFNSHNGYYGHGFEMKINDKEERSGGL